MPQKKDSVILSLGHLRQRLYIITISKKFKEKKCKKKINI